jgi:hypothetical protein
MSETLEPGIPDIPEIYSSVFDYSGNLTSDLNAAIISVTNPVGIGTTVNYLGEVVPIPVSFAQTSNPSISYSLTLPVKSPYIEPPDLLGIASTEVSLNVGIASTHRLSPSDPVIVNTSLMLEFNDATNTLKPSTLIVGVSTVGVVSFTEEKKGQEITIDANVTGAMNGITMTVQGSNVLITVPGVGSATIPLTP